MENPNEHSPPQHKQISEHLEPVKKDASSIETFEVVLVWQNPQAPFARGEKQVLYPKTTRKGRKAKERGNTSCLSRMITSEEVLKCLSHKTKVANHHARLLLVIMKGGSQKGKYEKSSKERKEVMKLPP